MANGSLEWFLPNRLATTFPEFHNLKGIPQEKSYLFVRQWLNWNRPSHDLIDQDELAKGAHTRMFS